MRIDFLDAKKKKMFHFEHIRHLHCSCWEREKGPLPVIEISGENFVLRVNGVELNL